MLNIAQSDAMRTSPLVQKVDITSFTYEVPDAAKDTKTGKLLFKKHAAAHMSSFAIRVESNDQVGEYVAHMGGRPAILAQVQTVANGLVGMPVAAGVSFGEFAQKQLQTLGGLGVGALDIALWDLIGKTLNVSVGDLIGTYRSKFPAYASLVHGHDDGDLTDDPALVDAVAQCQQAGLRGVKFRGFPGRGAQSYISAVHAVANAFPDRQALHLFLDPGCDLATFADALQVGYAADDAGLFWLEDMFRDRGQSIAAHKRLRERIRTPLLCGEHVRGLEAKAHWISSGATDFIRCDPELDGGISGCMKIAHLAEAFGMDAEVHGSGPAHRHVMAALRNTNFYELGLSLPTGTNIHAPPIYACGYSDGFAALDQEGRVAVPGGAGLGVSYDWDKINATKTQHMVFQ